MASTPELPSATDVSDSLSDRALAWVIKRDRGLTARENEAFTDWLNADDRHPPALLEAERAWQGLEDLAAAPALRSLAEEVEKAALAQSASRGVARPNSRRQRPLAWTVLAAAAAFAVGAAVYLLPRLLRNPDRPAYTVLASTARRVDLPDGSIASINGSSRIATQFTATERLVTLIEGEAHFRVALNPSAPFVVPAGGIAIRALGTAFNVRLEEHEVQVIVTDGRVQIESIPGNSRARLPQPLLLSRGQAVTIPLDEPEPTVAEDEARVAAPVVSRLPAPQIARALSWQNTRLRFDDTRLADVVGAFNAYHEDKVRLVDATLEGIPLTGVFEADNLDGFLNLLAESMHLSVRRPAAGGIEIRRKP